MCLHETNDWDGCATFVLYHRDTEQDLCVPLESPQEGGRTVCNCSHVWPNFLSFIGRNSFYMGTCQDEPEQLDDWNRIAELQQRNRVCPPHLKTCYPLESRVRCRVTSRPPTLAEVPACICMLGLWPTGKVTLVLPHGIVGSCPSGVKSD